MYKKTSGSGFFFLIKRCVSSRCERIYTRTYHHGTFAYRQFAVICIQAVRCLCSIKGYKCVTIYSPALRGMRSELSYRITDHSGTFSKLRLFLQIYQNRYSIRNDICYFTAVYYCSAGVNI